MVKEIFSKHEKGVLNNLALEGIKNLKAELCDTIKDADCKEIWNIADLKVIEIKEAQCIIDKLYSQSL